MSSRMASPKQKERDFGVLLGVLLLLSFDTLAEDTINDSALWGGGLVLFENEDRLDYSAEYQLRLDDHMQSFSNHFVEFMGYNKVGENLLLNGGFRYTRRSDHSEARVYFGGFLDLTRTSRGVQLRPDQFRVTLQVGYQHDFNTRFDDQSVNSNSIRWILVASKPATSKITPFLLAGVLTTWNPVYSFGVDKIRLGGGIAYHASDHSRIRMQYIWEEARFRTPKKHTNILWLRYETVLGNRE
jgi:hypothetical protein